MLIRVLVALALLMTTHRGTAHAEVESESWWNGGMIPFFYGSAAAFAAARFVIEPPDSPRLFPANEGGLRDFSNTVPEWTLGVYAMGTLGTIALSRSPSRVYHLKGYAEALVTTLAVTEITKNLVGRHRPLFQSNEISGTDARRSFFSGHSSVTAVTSVYLALYVDRNLFSSGTGGQSLRRLALAGLAGVLIAVPASRVLDHKHHISDVVVGSFVGGAIAASFYAYQEGRFQDHQEQGRSAKRSGLQVVPDPINRSLVLTGRF